jgi:hypothetical protein
MFSMLSLQEYQSLAEEVDQADEQFDDDVIDKAESYDIDTDEQTGMTTVTVYDVNGAALRSAKFSDYDVALSYMEENFDLEDHEPEFSNPDAVASASRYGHD